MIKISDFARNQGVTPRSVQRLVKKYEQDLDGHIEKKGQNGTWLDEEAQEFLRSKMKQNPVVVYDENNSPLLEENQLLKAEIKELLKENKSIYKTLGEALNASKDEQLRLQTELAEQKLLVASREDAEKKVSALETENRALITKKIEIELKLEQTKEDLQEANFDLETAKNIAEASEQEAARAKSEVEKLKSEAEKLAAELAEAKRELEDVSKFSIFDFLRFKKSNKRKVNATTLAAMDDAESDKMQGPFENVQDLMSALNVEENEKKKEK